MILSILNKIIFIGATIVALSLQSEGQTFDELDKLFIKGQYTASIQKARHVLKKDKTISYPYEIIGQAYYSLCRYDSFLYYMNLGIESDKEHTYISCWCYSWLAHYYIYKGNDEATAFSELRLALDHRAKPSCISWSNEMLGELHLKHSRVDSAIFYLNNAIQFDNDNAIFSRQVYETLGRAYIQNGQKEKGIQALLKAISIDPEFGHVENAKDLLDSIGYVNPLEPEWITINAAHITYKFQFSFDMHDSLIMRMHEDAYDTLNKIFDARLPQKMRYVVWNDKTTARKLTGNHLGYASPKKCVCNVFWSQSPGHEMTHILSYWAWGQKPKNETKFITEGLAVAFDLRGNDKYAEATRAVTATNIHSVLDIWGNERENNDIIYSVGGAFLTFLYKKCTLSEFKCIVKDQTIGNARNIFGNKKFNLLIAEFNKLIGLQ